MLPLLFHLLPLFQLFSPPQPGLRLVWSGLIRIHRPNAIPDRTAAETYAVSQLGNHRAGFVDYADRSVFYADGETGRPHEQQRETLGIASAVVEAQASVSGEQLTKEVLVSPIGPQRFVMLREGNDDGRLLDDLFGYLDRYFLDDLDGHLFDDHLGHLDRYFLDDLDDAHLTALAAAATGDSQGE